jgi:membrane-associated phospholipid phosphatase
MFETLLHWDHLVFLFINTRHTAIFDLFFGTITWLGNGYVITPVILAIFLLKLPKHRWFEVIVVSTICLSVAGLLNYQIKDTTNRSRPLGYFERNFSQYNELNSVKAELPIHVIGEKLRGHSFTSGHTVTVFGGAVVISWALGRFFLLPFVIALFVGYSRIYVGAHFPIDVVAGAFFGTLLPLLMLHIFDAIKKYADRKRLKDPPIATPDQ